jgi:hypothetical protein
MGLFFCVVLPDQRRLSLRAGRIDGEVNVSLDVRPEGATT